MAIIDFAGPITNESSFFSFLFGEAVLPVIIEQMQAADADSEVDAIVLRIDSPGGPPAGLEEFNAAVGGLSKPIIGFSDGMIASGAMWVASSLDGIVVTQTAPVGSIGVIAVVLEFSKMMKDDGVTATLIRSGKLKAIGGRFEPLTEEAEATIQAEVDHLHGVFVNTVAGGLDMSVEDVSALADGRLFIGQQAVDVGLVDRIGLLNDAIDMALNINTGGTTMGAKITSVAELKTEYPEYCAELEKKAQAAVDVPDVSAAVSAETERVTALASAHLGEDEGNKFEAMVASGVTVDQYASMKAAMPQTTDTPDQAALEAEAQEKHLAALLASNPYVPGQQDTNDDGPKDFMAAVDLVAKRDKIGKAAAVTLAAKEFPKLADKQSQHTKGGA